MSHEGLLDFTVEGGLAHDLTKVSAISSIHIIASLCADLFGYPVRTYQLSRAHSLSNFFSYLLQTKKSNVRLMFKSDRFQNTLIRLQLKVEMYQYHLHASQPLWLIVRMLC